MSDQLSILAKELAKKGLNLITKTYHWGSIFPDNSPSQSIKHCIKCNEELERDAIFCSECGIKQNDIIKMQSSENITSTMLPKENNNINGKFIKAATQSKTDTDGYILMNEYALTLKSLGVEWDRDKGFKRFLENHKDVIEFKPDTSFNAPAIRIIMKTFEKDDFTEQKLKEADKIYLDTCALIETPIEKFFEKINPILKKYDKKIIVLLTVETELKKIAKSGKYELEKQAKAKNALDLLFPEMNEIEMSGEECDNGKIADQIFKIIFEKHRDKNKMLLISQDSKLSNEILNMNNSEAVRGKKCVVCRINDDGYLCPINNQQSIHQFI